MMVKSINTGFIFFVEFIFLHLFYNAFFISNEKQTISDILVMVTRTADDSNVISTIPGTFIV